MFLQIVLHANESVMVACWKSDFGVDLLMATNSDSMPDWTTLRELVFIVHEHVRSCYLEIIRWKTIIDELLFMIWEPEFLKEYYFGMNLPQN